MADREGGRVECVQAGLQKPLHANKDDTGKRVVIYDQKIIGRPYAIAAKGKPSTANSEPKQQIIGPFSYAWKKQAHALK